LKVIISGYAFRKFIKFTITKKKCGNDLNQVPDVERRFRQNDKKKMKSNFQTSSEIIHEQKKYPVSKIHLFISHKFVKTSTTKINLL
jgi:hypothetical protein